MSNKHAHQAQVQLAQSNAEPVLASIRIALILPDERLHEQLTSLGVTVESVVINADSLFHQFYYALPQVRNGKVIELKSSHSQSLLIIDALTCAQLRIHPHAYLAAITHEQDKQEAINNALKQAKRNQSQIQHISKHGININIETQFSALVNAIHCLASRSKGESLNSQSSYWFMPKHQPRVTCLEFTTKQNTQALVLVQGNQGLAAKPLINESQLMLIVSDNSRQQLVNKLTELSAKINAIADKPTVLSLCLDSLKQHQPHHQVAVVLQAATQQQLQLEISAFLSAEKKNQQNSWHWKTPTGSCFYANAQAMQSSKGLTFVYPGVGTAYPDMLSTLHLYFPDIFAQLEQEVNLASMLQSDVYYNEKTTQVKPKLSQQAIAGVGTCYLLTRILQTKFELQPQFALGYSMGETAMWSSLGVWQNPESLIAATEQSPLFHSQLSGELTSVKALWKVDNNEHIRWNSFLVRMNRQALAPVIENFSRVYLTISQGDSCIISGCEIQCRLLLEHISKRAIASDLVTAMHTPAAELLRSDIEDFYRLEINSSLPDIKFITASHHSPLANEQLSSNTIAKTVADTFSHSLDFEQLIDKSIQSGSRVFVEIGADRQTSTLIEKITSTPNDKHNHSCVALAVDSKAKNSVSSLLTCIAQLISLRIPIKLQALLQSGNPIPEQKDRV
ncbi:MAG: PfaB family protein [Parashewanella sp.]